MTYNLGIASCLSAFILMLFVYLPYQFEGGFLFRFPNLLLWWATGGIFASSALIAWLKISKKQQE